MVNTTDKKNKPIIGISIGDINGIGPEVIIKALDNPKILKQFTPVVYGSAKVFSFYRKNLELKNFYFKQINSLKELKHNNVNILNVWNEAVNITPGKASETGGTYALKSLKAAVKDVKEGKIDALTTAPLSKDLVQSNEFQFRGHTEYLTEEAGEEESLMFLISDSLRIGVVTGHIPLKEVHEKITKKLLQTKLLKMIKSLQEDFSIKKPKVAVMGLNPHAGENGLLGQEEKEIIEPSIKEMKKQHHIVMGPFPSDGFFGQGTFKQFDGILAMYHDQGLIPFKLMAFDDGVNYTAGLPFIRTSPDHGTAFGIAGKNEASPASFRNALYLAFNIVSSQIENKI